MNATMHRIGIPITVTQNWALAADHSRLASQPNPENVVSAPQNPERRTSLRSPDVVARTRPAMAEPAMFTVNRPHGTMPQRPLPILTPAVLP